MKKITWAIVIIIILVIVGSGLSKDPSPKENEIVIGAPLSLSGNAASDSENIKRGIDLAVEDLVRKGVKVRVVYEDDKTNPAETVSAVQKIYATEARVDALIGLTWGFLVDAAAKIVIDNKTVVYSPANTSEIVNARSPYIFYGTIKNAMQNKSIEQWLKSVGSEKVAIIVDNTAWGDSHLDAFSTGIERAGAQLVITERIPLGAEKDTMPTTFAKVKAAGADTIIWTGYEEGAAAVLIQKIQQQGNGMKLLSASAIPVGLVKNKTVSIRPQDDFYTLKPQSSLDFGEKFNTRYGTYPGSYAESAYDGVMLIVDGLSKKKSDQTLADYLHSGVSYQGYQMDYKFDANGDIEGGIWIVEKLQ